MSSIDTVGSTLEATIAYGSADPFAATDTGRAWASRLARSPALLTNSKVIGAIRFWRNYAEVYAVHTRPRVATATAGGSMPTVTATAWRVVTKWTCTDVPVVSFPAVPTIASSAAVSTFPTFKVEGQQFLFWEDSIP